MKQSHVASIDVDAQKTFTPVCPNELPVKGGDEIADELNKNAEHAEIRILSRDGHPPKAAWIAKTPEQVLTPVGMPNVDVYWPEHGTFGTKGFELIDGLPHPVTGYDLSVIKGTEPDCHPYGACYHDLDNTRSTGIIEFLKAKNISHVIVGGLALDYCVKITVLQLVDAGFKVILNLAATRAVTEEGAKETIDAFENNPAVITVKDHSALPGVL